MAQFIDAGLLLCQQLGAVDDWPRRGHAGVERALAPHVRDMGGANHDLGRHAADVDAGAADRPAFDERDARAQFGCLQRRGHRTPAAADDSDVQLARLAAGLGAATEQAQCLVQQACTFRRGGCVGQRGAVAESGHRGREYGQGCVTGHGQLRRAMGIGHDCRAHAGHILQRLLDVRGARVARHASDLQLSHGFPPNPNMV